MVAYMTHTLHLSERDDRVSLKEMNLSYGIEKVFREVIPNLKHGNDGLIFTSAVAPYVPSTNNKMYKDKIDVIGILELLSVNFSRNDNLTNILISCFRSYSPSTG